MTRHTMFYPMVEQGVFLSLDAMCEELQIPRATIDEYVTNAAIERSSLVVCDRLVLGDPAKKMCAVFLLNNAGAVTLWCALVGKASRRKSDVLQFIALMQPKSKRPILVGTFVPALHGNC